MKISDLKLEKGIKISQFDALIVVDIQNDFLPGGSLPVEKGDEIIGGINKIIQFFKKCGSRIILTQDWHPSNHASFASVHPGMKPFDQYKDIGIGPVLWPDHCVQGKKGAAFHLSLNIIPADAIIRKGTNTQIDSYSTFIENDKKSETGLSGYLKSLKITRFFICGLALDYCVYFSAIDGKKLGFDVYCIIDLTRGIDSPKDNISNSLEMMIKTGIKFINSKMLQE